MATSRVHAPRRSIDKWAIEFEVARGRRGERGDDVLAGSSWAILVVDLGGDGRRFVS